MAEFVLFATIIMFILALVWGKSSFPDLFVKVTLSVMTVWGIYTLFGPANVIAQLSR